MTDTEYTDIRESYAPQPEAWKYWFLLAALALGPLYALLLPILVS